jgi:hypothetical protein
LGGEGPRHIYAPAEASLKPFEPWPYARYISGLLAQGDRLVMAVNREGFLAAIPGDGPVPGDISLYRRADPLYWGNYTAGALFSHKGIPAVLLYRNDFFSTLAGEPPEPPVWGLLPGELYPVPLEVPALDSAGGEPDSLRRGPDGYWYYRVVQRDAPQPGIRYLRSPDLVLAGEEVSLGAYRNSAQPEPLRNAPPVLAETLEAAFFIAGKKALNIAAVASPEFTGPRHFASGGAETGEGLTELFGWYQAGGAGSAGGAFDYALAILPDGRGVYGRTSAGDPLGIGTGLFSLPPLPEGFVYTGLGQAGQTLIAPWEERQEGSVGAAGFMAIDMIPLSTGLENHP